MKEIDKASIEKLKKLVENAHNVCIVTHTNPDGDTMGSSAAIAGVMRQMGKFVNIIVPNDCPEFLHWLPNFEYVRIFFRQKKTAVSILEKSDLIFCMDYNNLDRTDEVKPYLEKNNAPKVLIDHHPNPQDFADVLFSETAVSSTSELLYEILQEAEMGEFIDADVASAIYCGIITDTGGLNHNSSNARTYRTIAGLLERGIDKSAIHENIFQNHSYERMMLLGTCLHHNFKLFEEHRAACIYITLEDQKKYHFRPGDSEGFVNYPLAIANVDFTVLFTEKENMVKASFRSKGSFPANEFSKRYFNGGGHRNAAGGKHDGTLQEAIELYESKLPEFMEYVSTLIPS